MADGLTTGMLVEEIPGDEEAIGLSPGGFTAFIGATARGPVHQPVPVNSVETFRRTFGRLDGSDPLAETLEDFFTCGGDTALVVRVVNGARSCSLVLRAGSAALILHAVSPGDREWLRASVDYDHIDPQDSMGFNLVVQRLRVPGTERVEEQEIFNGLSVDPSSDRFVADALASSGLVRVRGRVPPVRPDATVGQGVMRPVSWVEASRDGRRGQQLTDYDLIGSAQNGAGLFALDQAPRLDFLCLPPRPDGSGAGPALLLAAMRYCRHRAAMLVIDPPADCDSPKRIFDYIGDANLAGPNAMIAFPGLERAGMDGMRPNSGAVAGALARHDHRHGVWVSDGERPAVLATGLRPFLTLDGETCRRLTAQGINVLTRSSGGRLGLYGDTTLAGRDAPVAGGHSLSERRLYLRIHDTLSWGTRWAVFSRPGPATWRRLTVHLNDLMGRLFGMGAFGEQPVEDAYFVRCDARTNRAEDPDVCFVVGYAMRPGRPYTVVHVRQSVAGATVTPISMDRYRILSGDWQAGQRLREADSLAGHG